MNYAQAKRKFKKNQIHSSLKLLQKTRVIFHLLSGLNWVDDLILKMIIVLLGFQYDIYIRLRETSYDNAYLNMAEKIKYQIELTLRTIER